MHITQISFDLFSRLFVYHPANVFLHVKLRILCENVRLSKEHLRRGISRSLTQRLNSQLRVRGSWLSCCDWVLLAGRTLARLLFGGYFLSTAAWVELCTGIKNVFFLLVKKSRERCATLRLHRSLWTSDIVVVILSQTRKKSCDNFHGFPKHETDANDWKLVLLHATTFPLRSASFIGKRWTVGRDAHFHPENRVGLPPPRKFVTNPITHVANCHEVTRGPMVVKNYKNKNKNVSAKTKKYVWTWVVIVRNVLDWRCDMWVRWKT